MVPLSWGLSETKSEKKRPPLPIRSTRLLAWRGLTKTFGVSPLLSEATYQKLPNPQKYHLRFLGQVQVKGKTEPMRIYECFDGNPPELRQLKTATLAEFDKAMGAYLQQQFAEASVRFKHICEQNPADSVAAFYLSRCGKYLQEGVPEDWAGVELIAEK